MKTPDPMLPPESAPWGRHVNEQIRELTYSTSKNNTDIVNALKGLSSTVTRMSKQIEDLTTLTESLASQQAQLNSQQNEITNQQNYLTSLVSRDVLIPFANTGTLISDGQFHFFGAQGVISNLEVPTGKVRVTLSCSEASIDAQGNSVIASVNYGVDGIEPLDATTRYARLYAPSALMGVSLARIGTVTMPPGVYTFRAQASYWSSGGGNASISYSGIRLLVEVINND